MALGIPVMTESWTKFAETYNDIEKHPDLVDVALALGLSYQTVRNKSVILRRLRKKDKKVPALIDRVKAVRDRNKAPEDEKTPRDHAHARAVTLSEEITGLVTGSHYPLINPEAIKVESYISQYYSRRDGYYIEREGTPRTWLSDTLRVAPIKDPRNRKFIFTGAQNDAPIHQGFWRNLKAFAAHIGASIVVGCWTYETQWWSENNPTSRSYANELSPFLCFGQMAIGDGFIFCGEMNTLPTANRPISDLQTYSRGRWAVFPHAKLQLKSVPSTDPSVQAHQVMTSGSVTVPKVIPRKAGVKSIFHHVIGATLVEFDHEGDIFCRQINASEDGSFYELDRFVKNGKVSEKHRLKAASCPDIHTAKLGLQNAQAIFGVDIRTSRKVRKDNLLDTLDPLEVYYHDLFDNMLRSHWTEDDNAYNYEVAKRSLQTVLDEVDQAGNFLVMTARKGRRQVVVDSNHDLALERYVREGRYRCDGNNIRFGLQLEDKYLGYREEVARCLEAYQPTPSFSLLEYAIRLRKGDRVRQVEWVHDGKSRLVDGVEYGNHGFRGANGARGSVAGFAQIGKKITIGHIHSPEICDGVYCGGVMELQHGYNKGPSSWAVSLVIQYPNGKRAIVTLQKGKWRA